MGVFADGFLLTQRRSDYLRHIRFDNIRNDILTVIKAINEMSCERDGF